MDQANRLRGLIRGRTGDAPPRGGRTVAVASGKGGVGKSQIALNLAVALANGGANVALIDADLGLGSLDLLCGVSADWNLSHVATGAKRLAEILVDGPAGVKLAAGASGSTDLADAPPSARKRLLDEVAAIGETFDLVLLDTSAGLHRSARSVVAAADLAIVVTTAEPTAIADAYALVKSLSATPDGPPIELLVNRADATRAAAVYDRLAATAAAFLGLSLTDSGSVPDDPAVPRSAFSRTPFVLSDPRCPAALAVRRIGERLLSAAPPSPAIASAAT